MVDLQASMALHFLMSFKHMHLQDLMLLPVILEDLVEEDMIS